MRRRARTSSLLSDVRLHVPIFWHQKLTSVLDAFKPGSVADVPGYLTNHASGSKEMTFDIVVSLEALFADWMRADWTRMVVSKCLTFARRLASRVNAS